MMIQKGTTLYDYAVKAQERRSRLTNPPNAIIDKGIDLRRGKSRAASKEEVIKVKTAVVQVTEVSRSGRNRIFPSISTSILLDKPPSLVEIHRATSEYFGIPMSEIRSDSRRGPLAKARHMIAWLGRTQCGMTWWGLSRLPQRDHTCAMNSYWRIQDLVEKGDEATINDLHGIWDRLVAYRTLAFPHLRQPDLALKLPHREGLPGPEVPVVAEGGAWMLAAVEAAVVPVHQLQFQFENNPGAAGPAWQGLGQLPENPSGFSSSSADR